jgi:hypothetical protein
MGWRLALAPPARRPATKAELQAALNGMTAWAAKLDAALAIAATGAETARAGAEAARVAFREYNAGVIRLVEGAIREAPEE